MQRVYVWESYPEYITTQQYSRCLGRVLVTLPLGTGRKYGRSLIRGAILIAQGIAGAHAETPDDQPIPQSDREQFRKAGLEMIARSRSMLITIRAGGHGDRANVLAALELLERVEAGLLERALPASAPLSTTGPD